MLWNAVPGNRSPLSHITSPSILVFYNDAFPNKA
jgi:hypothetical protein